MKQRSSEWSTAAPLRLVPRVKRLAAPAVEASARRPVLDDAEILAGLRRGDRAAVRALYDRARPGVDKTILRILGGRDADHDELAQLALIQLVESMERFRGECSLDTWISRVAAYTVYGQLPKRRTQRRIFSRAPVGDVHDPFADGPEERAAKRSTLARVRQHLDALDPDKAWTLVLHDVCGYDLREIALITTASVTAAQTRLFRGRRELQARIEADPELADVLRERGRGADER